jgi:hypothetical protein
MLHIAPLLLPNWPSGEDLGETFVPLLRWRPGPVYRAASPKTSEFEKSNGWHGVQWRFWDWILSDVTPCSPANDRICFRRLPLKAPVGFWCF